MPRKIGKYGDLEVVSGELPDVEKLRLHSFFKTAPEEIKQIQQVYQLLYQQYLLQHQGLECLTKEGAPSLLITLSQKQEELLLLILMGFNTDTLYAPEDMISYIFTYMDAVKKQEREFKRFDLDPEHYGLNFANFVSVLEKAPYLNAQNTCIAEKDNDVFVPGPILDHSAPKKGAAPADTAEKDVEEKKLGPKP